jgi:2-amino-4-hydroxy-6-hydroxymethyldihydropteridine diphosphokinase
MSFCLVALGSNLGDRAALIESALARLGSEPGIRALILSSLHETQPVGGASGQQPFLNAVAAFDADLSPLALLALLQRIEHELGRQRSERWGARTIDLDLLLYGDQEIDTPELIVPHPRMAFRRFVVQPAAEVAPQLVHPTIGWSMTRLLEHLDAAIPYVALLGMPGSGKTRLATSVAAAVNGRYLADPAKRPQNLPVDSESGPVLAQDIELLAARSRLLDRTVWSDASIPAISDFYLDQGLAYAETRLPADELAAYRRKFDVRAAQVVLPKLLVVLDTRPSPSPGEGATDIDPGENLLRRRLLVLAARPGIAPVLYVGRDDSSLQLQEVAAAVQAMEARSTNA